jgi:ribosomal protein S27E
MAALDRQQMRRAADVIVALHEEFGPMPDYEQEEHFRRVWPVGCAHLYRQARSIARDQGRIRDSGLRIRNPASGRQQVVWESCEVPPIVIVKCELCGHVLRRRVT